MGWRVLSLCMSVLVASAAPGVPAAAETWRPRVARAEAFARDRAGDVSFGAINQSGRLFGRRFHTTVPAASVVKVMFLAAYLRRPSVRSRPLRDADRRLLAPMIKRSDNVAATRIADQVGARAMNRLAADAGMRNFSYTRPWGNSRITARDQARFMFRLERFLPRRHERYARYLLRNVVSSQRWGIGRVRTGEWKKHFKGGWGSGSGAVDHQVVFLQNDDERVALAVMTTNSPSHAYAKRTLRGVFARLLGNLPRRSA